MTNIIMMKLPTRARRKCVKNPPEQMKIRINPSSLYRKQIMKKVVMVMVIMPLQNVDSAMLEATINYISEVLSWLTINTQLTSSATRSL